MIAYELGLDAGPRPMSGDKKVTATYPSQNTFEYYLDPKTVVGIVKTFFR